MSEDPCSPVPVIEDMEAEVEQKTHCTLVYWNRVEGWPRAPDFTRALKAEVRDALWMLTRQWQMGEFQGDDAGSPVGAKIHLTTTPMSSYQPGTDGTQSFPQDLPLEALVEQRSIPLGLGIRLQMGRHWLNLIRKTVKQPELSSDLAAYFKKRFPIEVRDDDPAIQAHAEVLAYFKAVAGGRSLDGAALYQALSGSNELSPPGKISEVFPGLPKGAIDVEQQIADAVDRFKAWFKSLYSQPPGGSNDAWIASQLEYKFGCSVTAEQGSKKDYVADEYYHGRLDWYNLDLVDPQRPTPVNTGTDQVNGNQNSSSETRSFFPAPVSYGGMPNTRWWTFEDGFTNFGDIRPDTTDPAKLLFIEFGLIYANDWFLLPSDVPAGGIVQVKGLAVTNVFGERFWIRPANKGPDEDWQRWSMFTTSIRGSRDVPAETSVMVLPTVPKIQEGMPIEEVVLIRDEVANMVWGIETSVPLPDGSSKRGSEAATEVHSYWQRQVEKELAVNPNQEAEQGYKAPIRYQVMNTVPENWIPFIPVHVEKDIRQVQLQRAAMLRILKGDQKTPSPVQPRTGLLATTPNPYFIHEEEVPRAGVRVTQSFQRTRWYDGKVVIWVGVHKGTGHGEGSSGLAFDQIIPVT